MSFSPYIDGVMSVCVRTGISVDMLTKAAGSGSMMKAYRRLIPYFRKFTEEQYGPTLKGMARDPEGKAVFSSSGKFIPPRMVSPLQHNVGLDVDFEGGKAVITHNVPVGRMVEEHMKAPDKAKYVSEGTIYQKADRTPQKDWRREQLDEILRKLYTSKDKFTKGNASALTGGRTITSHGGPALSKSLAQSGRQGAFAPVDTVAHEVGHTVISPYLEVPESAQAITSKLLTPGKGRMTTANWDAARDYDLSLAQGQFSTADTPKNLPFDVAGHVPGVKEPVGVSERMADLYAADFHNWMQKDPVSAAAYQRAHNAFAARERSNYARLVRRGVIPEVDHPKVRPVGPDSIDRLAAKVPATPSTQSIRQMWQAVPKAQRSAMRQVNNYEDELDEGLNNAMNLY